MDDMSSFAPESKGSSSQGGGDLYAQYDEDGAVFFGGKYVSGFLT